MSNKDSQNTYTLILMSSGRRGRVEHGILVLDAARKLGVEVESICGGRQTCEKCRVVVEEGCFDKPGITSKEEHLSPRMQVGIELGGAPFALANRDARFPWGHPARPHQTGDQIASV